MIDAKNFYDKINLLIADLRKHGQSGMADCLEKARGVSMQSGEIIGEISLCLKHMIASDEPLPENLRAEASECLVFIKSLYQ